MVVLLSVACVVAGEAEQEPGDVAELSQMNSHPSVGAGGIPAGDGDACKTEPTGSECPRISSEPEVPPAECVGSTEKNGCKPVDLNTKGSCPDDSKPSCPPKAMQEVGPAEAEEHRVNTNSEHSASIGPGVPAEAGDSDSNVAREDSAEARPAGTPGEQPQGPQAGKETEAFPSPAAPEPVDKSPAVPVSKPETESGDKSSTDESAAEVEGTEAQPSPSPTNSTQENTGDNNANVENGSTTEGSASSNNPANEESTSTTTTTTTTTTLPPELTNNKKGDADSSSIISSSVWVRVPLLIVVTLACILVC
ncbi:uncharacterized protein TM35_000471130 [Trypanosoma theileri]|uniref:Titin n=1 Tax=Trypanosoma theileri TaxID=67003 RepID=A0A1X0NI69_9TRYP|nr:uncharacterized protein TM35_000471130 [Trypanosoma theileri]ORC84218.1 hypothetical protein TM35_000471130 [Trypanosoma theileri]